jgi:ubiquinone/menaquinone biosynthesis C-methylase UbiE
MLEKFPIAEIVDLDISENMLTRAQERWRDNRARFVLYNGFDFPFPDSYFDTVYSVATLQHIDKNVAFLIFRELYRVLAPRGHGVLHVLSVRHIPHSVTPYDVECWNHIRNNANEHWHHYYSLEELFVLFSELIQVDELDIRYLDEALWIHFSKATGRKFMSEKLPLLAGMGKYASAVEYPGLLDSRSYKIGRAITYPWRCVLELLKRHVK